ncbi:DNA polymerase III subunit delta [Planctomyces sp. SH-PL62]|uniref:DNA polymerase III subunit delta n=1 Tax=Planctomyces sp. SH-PL62 TaxID=1636152 RepID=UPI00078D7987|nr:DNA polymerase III subunit delta [Planctomyces sp. SH-PL62]AMV39767.1 DNA polymerase III subunit delta [Planctomyces sp. SH-PL62]
MRGLDWLKDGSGKGASPLYVVFGDDPYLRREAIKRAIGVELSDDDDEMGVARFEGASAKLADVVDELRTLPFFSKRRVVLVEEADPFVSAYRKELEAYVEAPSSSGSLILAVRSWPGNTRLAKSAAKAGMAIDCSSPPEADLLRWLPGCASKAQSKLGPDAAKLLLELVGPELGILTAEVDKLAIATAHVGEIRREDVAKFVEAGRIEEVWDVVNAATEGRGDVAARLLDDLIAKGEHPVKLLAQMTSSLMRLHHAGRLRAARLSVAEACEIAGIRPFAVQQTTRQHSHLGPGRVDQLPAWLLQADLDVKGGSQLNPRVVLERLLVRLSQPRRD